MKKMYLLLLLCLLSIAGFSQTYCNPSFGTTCSYNMWIHSFAITGYSGSISDASSCTGSIENLTGSTSVSLYSGATYNATVDVGSSYSVNVQVWIDFNNDGTFASSETVGGGNADLGSTVIPLTIPAGSTTGTTRMRILESWNGSGYTYPSLTACGSYSYGEARDYSVTISAPPACSGTPTAGTLLHLQLLL